MSLNQDSSENSRYLLHHYNSGDLFECFSRIEAIYYLKSGEVDDVTGVEYYENLFKNKGK